MQIGYSWSRANRPFGIATRTTLAVFAIGLFALPITMRPDKAAEVKPESAKPSASCPATRKDARTVRLERFFIRLHCPVRPLADEFVHAADDNHLDWRLLPSISVIESGGGKAYKNNNIFGWANGEYLFPSIRSGIREVAYKLGRSPLYRNRDVIGKLRIYNPNEGYVENVVMVMNRISPVVNLAAARRPVTVQETYE